jgi:hypothetical protein
VKTFNWDDVSRKVVAFVKKIPTLCDMPVARKGIKDIFDF